MKKAVGSIVLLLVIFSVAGQPRGTVKHETLKSRILGVEKEYTVYLPPGYDHSDRSYPILYLLHGAWDDHRSWTEKGSAAAIADRAIAEGTALPLIIVMPDASGEGENKAGKNMGYFNMPGWAYEDFFIKEFIPNVEKLYRVQSTKQTRAIAGLSMGGGGAALFGQRHPDMFGSACPLSGVLMAPTFGEAPDVTAEFRIAGIEYDPQKFLREANDRVLAAQRTVRWYVDCGDDDFLVFANLDFFRLMREKGIPVEFRVRDGGHDWLYWQESLRSLLTFISVGFAAR